MLYKSSMTNLPDTTWVTWTLSDIERQATEAIAAKEAAIAAILALPANQRTFINTVSALEHSGDRMTDIQQILQFLTSTHPVASIRDAAQFAHDRMDAAGIRMTHDRRIWNALQEWLATGEQNRLDGASRKLADDTVRDMKRIGFALPEDQFNLLQKKRTELQKIESEFERAINEWDDGITLSREELDGLPERYIDALSRTPDGFYRVSLKYPDLFPFLEMAHADAPRRALATKNLQKGGLENLQRLARMIQLRQEIAGMLGYPTHADCAEEIRMARTATAATEFITRLITHLQPAAQAQLRTLINFKKEALGLDHAAPIHFHEIAYWSYRLKRERYALDGEMIKAYFPLNHVLTGMMDIYQDILGIRITPLPEVPVWHPDVRAYALHDSAGDRLIGHFFFDLHPRPGKYGHAAAFPLRLGRDDAPQGSVALVCNFPKPTDTDPGLLDHGEVETLLHEFGHVMHALLSSNSWQSQNGFGVPLDFVEALSQIFEYWAWHPDSLQKLSSHWHTGEPLPAELLATLQKVRREFSALSYLRQAVQGLYDLNVHSQPIDTPVEAGKLAALHRSMRLEFEHIDLPNDAIYPAGWGHMTDYDAGYYSYLWSKVYAADMFTRFAQEPLAPSIGARYRKCVLEPGASRRELDLVEDFLERQPSDAAFLAELGIA
jgi:oligopeptidase A